MAMTPLPLPLVCEGKVRALYDAGPLYLMVASDRISAFDSVMPTEIPYKGMVLNQLSEYWFRATESVIPNHFVSAYPHTFPAAVQAHLPLLVGRSMLVAKCVPILVECVVRGFMAGSAWQEYQSNGTVAGIRLPAGLSVGSRYPDPLFCPAIKNHQGHDENISYETLVDQVGDDIARQLKAASLAVYDRGAQHAAEKGLYIADTKFEFGWIGNQLTLIDEVFTPDSSRYWDVTEYDHAMATGTLPMGYDKQVLREYLKAQGATGPVALPDAVVATIWGRYTGVFERITGTPFQAG